MAYAKETPDTFVDGSEVVVEGSLGADGVFVAHTLLAKCPSKYEAQNRVARSGSYKSRIEACACIVVPPLPLRRRSGPSSPGP